MLDNVSFPSRRSRRDVHHRRQFGQPGEPIFPGGGDGPKGGNPQAAPAADTSTTPAPVQSPTSTPQTSTTPSSTSTASSTTPSSTSTSPTQPSASSTTASSASSTTGISTPSSAPPSTVPAPLSTSTPLAVVPSKPVANPTVNVVYETSTLGNAASAASASSSSTPAPQGGVSTGIIVGGVAAGAVAVIGILFGIVYFVRKRKSDEDDVLGNWNPDDVRRQSEMIHDSDPIMPSSGMGGMGMGGGGYGSAGARPPTMIERHVNNASPMLARQRSMGAQYAPQQPTMPAFDHNGYPIESGYGAGGYGGQQQRYADYPQDDFMRNMPPAGNPFMSPYEQPMASPVSSTVPIYDSRVVAEPSAAVTRQPSVTQQQQQQQGGPVRKPSLLSSPQEADAYADLDRSSVTPFQAQQYAEIQSKLHGGPQAGALGSVEEEQHHQQYHQQQQQQGGPTPPPAAVTPGRVSPTHSAPNQPIARSAPQGQDAAKRPDTMYSAIYDEEDVYGGI